jgi:hypothetical protein
MSALWLIFGLSGQIMISSTLKIAAALPIKPILDVFSRKCGTSETTEAGIAMESFLPCKSVFRLTLLKLVL